jgi:truncated hemoglobin YjbI
MDPKFDEPNDQLSLYDRLGGRVFITIIAERFCERLLADPKMGDVLQGADPDALKKAAMELGGELLAGHTSRIIPTFEKVGRQVHFSQSHFNRAISHLIAALVWAGVSRELIEELLDLVTPLSTHLVQPPASGQAKAPQ